MSHIDWSKAPEGATHFCETSGVKEFGKRENGIWFFAPPNGEWYECAWQGNVNFTRDDVVVRPVVTPTLETMLTELRDLNARGQAAQAEADALLEHAGQLHGEIVVRLAELGWGAPRALMVQGEPVVTLDTQQSWVINGHTAPDDATHFANYWGNPYWYYFKDGLLFVKDATDENDTFDPREIDESDRNELIPSMISRPSAQP